VIRIGAGLPGFAPTWSRDGTQLAFVQSCDEWCSPYMIFVASSDGTNVRSLTAGEQPAWRPHP
jgi:Tol biopolymer transport system component